MMKSITPWNVVVKMMCNFFNKENVRNLLTVSLAILFAFAIYYIGTRGSNVVPIPNQVAEMAVLSHQQMALLKKRTGQHCLNGSFQFQTEIGRTKNVWKNISIIDFEMIDHFSSFLQSKYGQVLSESFNQPQQFCKVKFLVFRCDRCGNVFAKSTGMAIAYLTALLTNRIFYVDIIASKHEVSNKMFDINANIFQNVPISSVEKRFSRRIRQAKNWITVKHLGDLEKFVVKGTNKDIVLELSANNNNISNFFNNFALKSGNFGLFFANFIHFNRLNFQNSIGAVLKILFSKPKRKLLKYGDAIIEKLQTNCQIMAVVVKIGKHFNGDIDSLVSCFESEVNRTLTNDRWKHLEYSIYVTSNDIFVERRILGTLKKMGILATSFFNENFEQKEATKSGHLKHFKQFVDFYAQSSVDLILTNDNDLSNSVCLFNTSKRCWNFVKSVFNKQKSCSFQMRQIVKQSQPPLSFNNNCNANGTLSATSFTIK